jgi:hypothetical protein
MITSFVLRLVLDDLERGQFTGEVQHVATGDRSLVRTRDELLEVLQRLGTTGVSASRRFGWSSAEQGGATGDGRRSMGDGHGV